MNARSLLTLAEAYAAASHRSLATVGRRACGNDGLFRRIAEGKGCHSDTLERAWIWFDHNWPEGLEWPPEVPRPSTVPRPGAPGGACSGGLERTGAPGRDCSP